jgi:hypothetical protein
VRRLDDILNQFLDRIGRSDGAPYVGMFRSWRQIVGERIADHAEPVDIRGTALVVEADHPGWVQMVMMERGRILSQINARIPQLTITSLHVRVAGDRAAAASAEPATAPPREAAPAPPQSADETEALSRIDDEDLRDSLRRLRETLEPDGK